ncbi:MAG: permease [bacterium]
MKGMVDNEKGGKKKEGNKFHGIYFLTVVIVLYLILFIFQQENVYKSLKASGGLFIQIAPLIVLVVFFIGAINYFVKSKKILKYTGKESGIKGWLIAVSTGILSHGPIYIWYPLLKELKDQGMRDGLIAVFLYNRAIKIPLLPLMIYYFGPIFILILLIYMIIASIIEGKIIEKIAPS